MNIGLEFHRNHRVLKDFRDCPIAPKSKASNLCIEALSITRRSLWPLGVPVSGLNIWESLAVPISRWSLTTLLLSTASGRLMDDVHVINCIRALIACWRSWSTSGWLTSDSCDARPVGGIRLLGIHDQQIRIRWYLLFWQSSLCCSQCLRGAALWKISILGHGRRGPFRGPFSRPLSNHFRDD